LRASGVEQNEIGEGAADVEANAITRGHTGLRAGNDN
jgi:hypothetical protein